MDAEFLRDKVGDKLAKAVAAACGADAGNNGRGHVN